LQRRSSSAARYPFSAWGESLNRISWFNSNVLKQHDYQMVLLRPVECTRRNTKGCPFWIKVWVLASNPPERNTLMTSDSKYIGMDVHKESISIAVRNAAGKIAMECVIETKASMILRFETAFYQMVLHRPFEPRDLPGVDAGFQYFHLRPQDKITKSCA
jgi:hypothetical protein